MYVGTGHTEVASDIFILMDAPYRQNCHPENPKACSQQVVFGSIKAVRRCHRKMTHMPGFLYGGWGVP